MTESTKRGWGPFTGGQLATMVCVLALGITVSGGAWATTGSNVSNPGAVNVAGSVHASSATASSLYHHWTSVCFTCYTEVASPPSGKSLVITSLWVNTQAAAGDTAEFYLNKTPLLRGARCSEGTFTQVASVTSITEGLQSIPMPNGLAIPAGEALCALGSDGGVSALETTFAFGYVS